MPVQMVTSTEVIAAQTSPASLAADDVTFMAVLIDFVLGQHNLVCRCPTALAI
jgi:hypothetical protein